MRGVSKTVVLPVEFLGFAQDNRGNNKAGFSTRTRLNRKDFGIIWNSTLDSGGVVLGDEVDIEINLELNKRRKRKRRRSSPLPGGKPPHPNPLPLGERGGLRTAPC